jgi:hypothetical protein
MTFAVTQACMRRRCTDGVPSAEPAPKGKPITGTPLASPDAEACASIEARTGCAAAVT